MWCLWTCWALQGRAGTFVRSSWLGLRHRCGEPLERMLRGCPIAPTTLVNLHTRTSSLMLIAAYATPHFDKEFTVLILNTRDVDDLILRLHSGHFGSDFAPLVAKLSQSLLHWTSYAFSLSCLSPPDSQDAQIIGLASLQSRVMIWSCPTIVVRTPYTYSIPPQIQVFLLNLPRQMVLWKHTGISLLTLCAWRRFSIRWAKKQSQSSKRR